MVSAAAMALIAPAIIPTNMRWPWSRGPPCASLRLSARRMATVGAMNPSQRHKLGWAIMVWILAWIIPALLGIALLWRGLRGRRIDDHPLCRRCGYDLFGTVEPANCPECGTKLESKRSVRLGHRKRRWVSLSLGLFVIALTTAGTILFVRARASHFDFNPYKPLWVLRW